MAADDEKPAPPIEQMLSAMEGWGASDLLVCAGRVPAVRLHGSVVALEVPRTPVDEVERFVRAALDGDALRTLDGEGAACTSFAVASGARFRLHVGRERGALSLVARALPRAEPTFDELQLPTSLAGWLENRRGLLLVAGSAGSGKSTTLAALVHLLASQRPVHIVVLETPSEMPCSDARARVSQREVGRDAPSYVAGIGQAAREGADVVVIDALDSAEAARSALDAALQGLLVLAAVSARDTTHALSRLVGLASSADRARDAGDLADALIGVAAQRLLPRSDGAGRVVCVETLGATSEVTARVREQRFDDLAHTVREGQLPGLTSFDAALASLCQKGLVAADSALAHAEHPDTFVRRLRGSSARGSELGQTLGLDAQSLLALVTRRSASDLHLSVGRPPILRIDGRLEPQAMVPVSASDLDALLRSIMSSEQRARFAENKECDFSVALGDGKRFRVNAYHQRGDVAVAFRAISSKIPDAASLGIPPSVLRMGEEPHGLLLVVGPTGAGKTTTLACLTDRINHLRPCHIITIEDPIEYVHQSDRATIHQREVGVDTGSFAAALKYILRQDPDVVLIGELRDLETVAAALTAAETGHLVMATLHTNDAVQTIDRIIDVFPPYQQAQARAQLAASLIGVVSQRLLPRADGQGRLAAFEVMVATPAIRTLVREGKMHQALGVIQTSRPLGMLTMEQALEDLVRRGAIDKDEAVRYMQVAGNADKSRPKPPA